MSTHIALGKQGEQFAADYLQRCGYTLVETNWRRRDGELDLVMYQGKTLVFVEVRTRRSGLEAAFESISPRKRRILERLAFAYLEAHDLDLDWRIDIVAVTLSPANQPIIEHIENALDW
jgi:putative endonuclease